MSDAEDRARFYGALADALRDEPFKPIEAGYYWTRLVRGGPKVPVRIWQDNDSLEWLAEVDGHGAKVVPIWNFCCGNPIDEAEYRFMVADSRHAKAFRPNDPKATPTVPIDARRIPRV